MTLPKLHAVAVPHNWFMTDVLRPDTVTGGLAWLSLAVVIGVAVGNVRFRGIRMGVAAVLFAALAFGQLGLTIKPEVLDYLRDFALVLFVYSLGLQMGPGFVASLRAEGLRLNALAVVGIALGAVCTAACVKLGHLPREAASGLFAGAFETTPALAAGQEALRHTGADVSHTNLAYSVTYPFGLAGPILLIILLRAVFKPDTKAELAKLEQTKQVREPKLAVVDVEVCNEALIDIPLKDQRFYQRDGVRLVRHWRADAMSLPTATTTVAVGDVFRARGPQPALDRLVRLMGRVRAEARAEPAGTLHRSELVVTHRNVLGKTLRDLDLLNRHGVGIAQVRRSGVELPPAASTTLHFGDYVTAVGTESGLKSVEAELGNSPDELNHTHLIPIFLGIALGIVAGSIPIAVPGLHTSVKVGLAGGPMLVAILLSRLGNLGSVVWYMPAAANQVLRDFGMAVFLACVGFESGNGFWQKLVHGGGLPLVAWGAVVTLVPMFVVACFARVVLRMNFATVCGLVSGGMTSSPTLLFANEVTGSSAPAVAYAAVYPLSMLAPVFCAQLLVTMMVG